MEGHRKRTVRINNQHGGEGQRLKVSSLLAGRSLAVAGVTATTFVTGSEWSRRHKVETQPGRREGGRAQEGGGERESAACHQSACKRRQRATRKDDKGEPTRDEGNRRRGDRFLRPGVPVRTEPRPRPFLRPLRLLPILSHL